MTIDKEKLISGIIGGLVAGISIGVGFYFANKYLNRKLSQKDTKTVRKKGGSTVNPDDIAKAVELGMKKALDDTKKKQQKPPLNRTRYQSF